MPNHDQRVSRLWNEATNRKLFKASLLNRDPTRAREIALHFSERLRPAEASPMERRLWEVAVAYSEVTNTGPARQQVRRFVRAFIKAEGVGAALVELQAWAKPHRCLQNMMDAHAIELTCESVIVEFPDEFGPDRVSRAKQALAKASRDAM